MIKRIVLGFVCGLGFAVFSAPAATYNGNLILGFTVQTGNDFELDLGPVSAITNGQTWNLSANLAAFNLSTVKWGVIGANNPGIRTAYMTKNGAPPSKLNGITAFNVVNASIGTVYSLFPTPSSTGTNITPSSALSSSWNKQTTGASSGTYIANVGNPNATGISTINFYKTVSDNSDPTVVGTFSLAANGVVTFTAASTAPPTPTLSITRNGSVSSISFLSANSATYTLYYTNSTGLTAPVTTWPTAVGTISGDGTTKTFTDTTTDANRFYKVKAQ